MSHTFRLLRTGERDAFFNMALDQAILEEVAASRVPPSLRFYSWKPAAVSIGYFQGMDEEVDTAACSRRGIQVVRRITGGGAVFHQTELTYSIVLPEGHPLAERSILESYRRICSGLVAGLKLLGAEARFVPINDIVVADTDGGVRKISGNAQTRKLGCILQHGTILLDVDVELMFELLKVPSEKAKGKLIQDVKARVTSLRALLSRDVSYGEAGEAMVQGFKTALDLNYTGDLSPTEKEFEKASQIAQQRFSSEAWNHRS